MMCYVCNDIKRAEMKKIHAKRVFHSLERLVPTRELKGLETDRECKKDTINFERQLSNSKSNIHLMCGRCVKFNDNEFKTVERNINKIVACILTYIIKVGEEDKIKAKKIKLNLCASLRGEYPIAYRLVEKTYINKCVKENKNEII